MNSVGEIFSKGSTRLAGLVARLIKAVLWLALAAVGAGVVQAGVEVGHGVEYVTLIVVAAIVLLGVTR